MESLLTIADNLESLYAAPKKDGLNSNSYIV